MLSLTEAVPNSDREPTTEPPAPMNAGTITEIAKLLTGIDASTGRIEATLAVAAERAEQLLDFGVETLIELRSLERRYPKLGDFANRLSGGLLLCDLEESQPRNKEPFNPQLQTIISKQPTTKPQLRNCIQHCRRIGVARGGRAYKKYRAQVVIYEVIQPANVDGNNMQV